MTLSLNCEFPSHRHNIAVQVLASYVHAEVGGEPAVGPLPVASGGGVGREEAALVETIDHHYACAKTWETISPVSARLDASNTFKTPKKSYLIFGVLKNKTIKRCLTFFIA